jgi:hypothetical protein
MDVNDLLGELWRNNDYMGMLTAVWKLSKRYNYRSLQSWVRDMTLRDLIFRACRQAVAISSAGKSERQRAQDWVEAFLRDFSPPAALIDHGDGREAEIYRQAMIRAHLYCVRSILLTKGRQADKSLVPLSPPQDFTAFAEETSLPLGFFRLLLHALLLEEQPEAQPGDTSLTVSLIVFLVEGRTSGVAAILKLERLPDGDGLLLPSPTLAFVRRDLAFRDAEENARRYVESLGIWKMDHDVCWSLERRDGRPLGFLQGPSRGFAFALGLVKLLAPS